MAFVSRHVVAVIPDGLELFASNSHAIHDAPFMDNVRTALAYARKDGMANIVPSVSNIQMHLIHFVLLWK